MRSSYGGSTALSGSAWLTFGTDTRDALAMDRFAHANRRGRNEAAQLQLTLSYYMYPTAIVKKKIVSKAAALRSASAPLQARCACGVIAESWWRNGVRRQRFEVAM